MDARSGNRRTNNLVDDMALVRVARLGIGERDLIAVFEVSRFVLADALGIDESAVGTVEVLNDVVVAFLANPAVVNLPPSSFSNASTTPTKVKFL